MEFVFHSLKNLSRTGNASCSKTNAASPLTRCKHGTESGTVASRFTLFFKLRTSRPFTNTLIIATKFPALCTSAPQFREIPPKFCLIGTLILAPAQNSNFTMGSWPSLALSPPALLRTVELLTWNEKKKLA